MASNSVNRLQQVNEDYAAQLERERIERSTWRPTLRNDDARDIFDRKLYQAEMLAHSLVGEGFEEFCHMHERIQEGMLWLLADTITEAREAMDKHDAVQRELRQRKEPAA